MSNPLNRMDLFAGLKTADDWKDEMADAYGDLAGIDYGADDGSVDDDLDAIEAEMFGEDDGEEDISLNDDEPQLPAETEIKGQLQIPEGMHDAVDAVAEAVSLDVVLPDYFDGGTVEKIVGFMSENVANYGDTRELATYISNYVDQGGQAWNDLPEAKKIQIVDTAIRQAAIPGLELRTDDEILDVYQRMKGVVKGEESVLPTLWEVVKLPMSTLRDTAYVGLAVLEVIKLPFVGDMLTPQALEVQDELVNSVAMFYFSLEKAGYPVGKWIVDKIDEEAADELVPARASQSFTPPEEPEQSMQPETEVTEYTRTDFIYEAAPPAAEGIRPQDILALGYAILSGGAVAGIFK